MRLNDPSNSGGSHDPTHNSHHDDDDGNKPDSRSSMDSKKSGLALPLSRYGDPDQRRFHPYTSMLLALVTYCIYLASCLLPVLVVGFAVALMMDSIEHHILTLLLGAVLLDFAWPLPNGYRPNTDRKRYWERMLIEGVHHYMPGRSIFLPTPEQLSPEKTYILAAWPHGLIGGGMHFFPADFARLGYYPIYSGASVIYYIPFLRRFLTTLGFCSVSKEGLRRVLAPQTPGSSYPHNIVHLVVGGIEEMFYSQYSEPHERILFSKRKGFVKLALETGADIIPLYSFGANQAWTRLAGPHSFLHRISHLLRTSLVVWIGRWGLPMGLVPWTIPILTVTGPVFVIPKVSSPSEITPALVDQVHADLGRAMKQLFDQYKIVYVEQMGADRSWLQKELKFEDEP